MARYRRTNSSQIRSKMRQAQNKINNAIRQYNNAVRQYNNKRRQAINAYNQAARSYNARVRSNRNRLQSEIKRLSQRPVTVRYTVLQESSRALRASYERLDQSDANAFLTDIAEQETANSVSVLNDLLDDDYHDSDIDETDLIETTITNELSTMSNDLNQRWNGALFALNPGNPDAARHFCTSSREILTEIIDSNAPDEDVRKRFPDCEVTPERGTPTRRSKIHYLLDAGNILNDKLENFIDANIEDVLKLFFELSPGTHGPAGTYSLSQLLSIKTRVEESIRFLCEIVAPVVNRH